MFWEEKIALIKSRYPNAFSAVHPESNRKDIFRKIETRFIKKDEAYFMTQFDRPFCHWRENIKPHDTVVMVDFSPAMLDTFADKTFWLACEFSSKTYLYEATLPSATALIDLGGCDTFFFIDKKFAYLTSIQLQEDQITLKYVKKNQSREK